MNIPVAIHYKVEIIEVATQCLFCSFDKCLCNVTFQQLVNGDLVLDDD